MGPWTRAATRLGLAGRQSVRISATLASKSETSLYLFLNEVSDFPEVRTNMVVRCIRLDRDRDTDSSHGDDDVEAELPSVANYVARYRNGYPLNCTTLGSKLLVPFRSDQGYRHICWVDVSKTPISFQVSSPTDTEIRSFTALRHDMRLGEIVDKLYCLDFKCDESVPHFEAFDPNKVSWQALDEPHFVLGNDSLWQHTMFFAESKRILTFHFTKSTQGMYCFDVTKPTAGWIKVTDPFLHDIICPHKNKPFFIYNHHLSVGDFYLLFTLGYGDTSTIDVGFMSTNCDFARPIDHVIQLPELCSRYLVDHDFSDHDKLFNHKFVRLGAQKFGLILNKYVPFSPTENKILLLTFEYDIVVTAPPSDDSAPDLNIETRLLGTRTFQYQTMGLPHPEIRKVDLVGAFMM